MIIFVCSKVPVYDITVLLAGRWFLYGLGLVISLGKINFWIFPNLDNEKLGFVESFKPFYSFEYRNGSKGSKGKKKKKDKDKVSKEKEQSGQENDQEVDEEGGGDDVEESEGLGEKTSAEQRQLTEHAS